MYLEFLSIELSAVVKAVPSAGKRLISVECSNETVDSELDLVEQAGLLAAAPGFLTRGHLDIDHLSELSERLGLRDSPDSFKIGRPLDVLDLGDGRTAVKAEMFRGGRAERIWDELTSGETYYASIFAIPDPAGLIDCRNPPPGIDTRGARRFLVKSFAEWRSLALCKNPINQSLRQPALVLAKSVLANLAARYGGQMDRMRPPVNRVELMKCVQAVERLGDGVSVFSVRQYLMTKGGLSEDQADLLALAAVHLAARRLSRAA